MKLNIRRLYAADGQAVRELLKLAGLLLRATQSAEAQDEVSRGPGARAAPQSPIRCTHGVDRWPTLCNQATFAKCILRGCSRAACTQAIGANS